MDDPRVLRILNDAAAGVDDLAHSDVEFLIETRLRFEEAVAGQYTSPFSFVMLPWGLLDRVAACLKREGY